MRSERHQKKLRLKWGRLKQRKGNRHDPSPMNPVFVPSIAPIAPPQRDPPHLPQPSISANQNQRSRPHSPTCRSPALPRHTLSAIPVCLQLYQPTSRAASATDLPRPHAHLVEAARRRVRDECSCRQLPGQSHCPVHRHPEPQVGLIVVRAVEVERRLAVVRACVSGRGCVGDGDWQLVCDWGPASTAASGVVQGVR